MADTGQQPMIFSIIIATYNSAKTLRRTLESLQAQRGAAFEVLLSDGASSDDTMRIAANFGDIITHSLSEPDQGVYDAWNKVIPEGRGEWLLFLGSDDWLEDADTLAKLAQAVAALPVQTFTHSFVFGTTELREGDQLIEQLGTQPLPQGRLGRDDDVSFSHTGLLHHRSLFADFGLFDSTFRSAGDYEFLLRTSGDPRVRFHHVPLVVAQMGTGGLSTGTQGRLRHYREMVLAREKRGVSSTPLWLRMTLMRASLVALLNRYAGKNVLLACTNIYRRISGKPMRSEYR